MKQSLTFLKALLKGQKSPYEEQGYLTMDATLRLLEDVDYETFSPAIKSFIQNQYRRLDAINKLKSKDC